ncbi:MAG TPA: IS1595 family transposase, partial [Bacteroidales bacterium]|nr:IS1595 family transposase [Bacteroidales bacterium]
HTDYWVNKRALLICTNCKDELSLTAGTIFHRSKLPLTTIFRALWWMVAQKNGVSALGLQRILGLGSYRTAWTWLHKFRRLMVFPGRDRLSGYIEVDETLVGGKKTGKRGRGAEGKSLVVMAIELMNKGTGRVRMSVIPDATKRSLTKFIKENIAERSTLITDGWKGYTGISENGYHHVIEDNTKMLDGREVLPNVHRVASLLKRWLLGTHQNYISEQYLSYYLDEYTFRHNRRKSHSRGLLFQRLIEQAVIHVPVEYKSINRM